MSSYEGDPRQLNAGYASGIYRRRIALHSRPGEELAELEDGPHGFRLRLLHDVEVITGAQPQALRYPFTTRAGAPLMSGFYRSASRDFSSSPELLLKFR